MAGVGEFYVEVRPQTAGFVGRLQRDLNAAANTVSQSFSQRLAGGMDRVGQTMTRRVTLPIMAAGGAAIFMASQFETAMSRMVGLAGVPAAEVEQLRGKVLDLAGATARPPQELAEALYFITSSGQSGAQALETLRASARAAASGLGETQVVADAVTSVMAAYGAENITAARTVDILTASVKFGKAEADQLAAGIGNLAPLASQLGVSFDQVGASIAAMTMVGVDVDTAFTNMSAIFSGLLKTTPQAAEELAKVGLSAEQLRDTITQPGGILVALRQIDDAFGGNEEAMARVFPNIRALRGVMALLAQNGEQVDEVFRGVADSTGLADKAFKTASETSAFKFEQQLAKLQRTAVELGTDLLPIAQQIVSVVGDMADGFRELPDWSQNLLIGGAAAAAALGPLLRLTAGVIKLGAALKTLTVGKTAGELGGLFGMFGKGSIGAIAGTTGAIAALGAGVGVLIHNLIGAESVAEGTRVSLKKLRDGTYETSAGYEDLRGKLANARDALANVRTLSGETIPLNRALRMSADELRGAYGSMAGQVIPAVDMLREGFKGWKEQAREVAKQHPELAGQFMSMAQAAGLPRTMVDQLAAVFRKFGADAAAASVQAQQFNDKMATLFGGLNIEAAQLAFTAAMDRVNASLLTNGATLDLNTQAGQANRQAIVDATGAAISLAQAMIEQGQPIDAARFALMSYAGGLAETMRQAGLTEEQIQSYLFTLGLTPDQIMTLILADDSQAVTVFHGVDAWLQYLDGRTVTVQIAAEAAGAAAGALVPGLQHGGPAAGLTMVGEQGRELALFPTGSRVVTAGETRRFLQSVRRLDKARVHGRVVAPVPGGTTQIDASDLRQAARELIAAASVLAASTPDTFAAAAFQNGVR